MRTILAAIAVTAVAITFAPGCADPDPADAPQAASGPADLRIDLAMRSPASASYEAVIADVTIVNTSDRPVRLLSWFLPATELQEPVFTITRSGQPVAFIGPHYKRAPAAATDFVVLAPGARLASQVELSRFYDFSQTGDYTVQVAIESTTLRAQPGLLTSQASTVWVERRLAVTEKPVRDTCTASEKALIATAITSAGQIATGARDYLSGSPAATPRYTTWFGTFSNGGWATARSHFTALADAFATQPIQVDCKCGQKNVYAYVYPDQPYKIFVCGAFWQAPMTGTDSKAGTLVHEMSHFNVVAATDDWAYGQTACRSLALSDPARALDNADSHEYFAENTPAQP